MHCWSSRKISLVQWKRDEANSYLNLTQTQMYTKVTWYNSIDPKLLIIMTSGMKTTVSIQDEIKHPSGFPSFSIWGNYRNFIFSVHGLKIVRRFVNFASISLEGVKHILNFHVRYYNHISILIVFLGSEQTSFRYRYGLEFHQFSRVGTLLNALWMVEIHMFL